MIMKAREQGPMWGKGRGYTLFTLYFLSSPPDMIRLLVGLQSRVRMSESWAFHWVGLEEGCNGLMIRVLPPAYRTWSESGDQQQEYIGEPGAVVGVYVSGVCVCVCVFVCV